MEEPALAALSESPSILEQLRFQGWFVTEDV